MNHLNILDLSQNRISRIESGTFSGLSLRQLFLAENPGIILSPGAFQGIVSAEYVFLEKNMIQSLDEETFWPLAGKVQRLLLYENALTTISKTMKPFFDTLAVSDCFRWL